MESRPDFFPVYVSGQYLTSEHLNETQNFLWQEEKATRYLLAGNGIVKGLTTDFSGSPLVKQVAIFPGAAVTIDGYLVEAGKSIVFEKGAAIQLTLFTTISDPAQIMEKTAFDKVKAKINPIVEIVLDTVEIFSNTIPNNKLPDGAVLLDDATIGINAALALSNYLVLAWVFISDQENNHCQQGDCNTKGIQRNLITRYFLVKNNGKMSPLNSMSSQLPTCSVSRLKRLADAGGFAGLNQRSVDAWNSSAKEFQGYFTNSVTGKQLGIVASLLGNNEQIALSAAIARFGQIKSSASLVCPQYYNLFAGDLAKAINEMVVFYNEYAKKYPTISNSRIAQSIIIGSIKQIAFDQWRYYFLPAPEQVQFNFDKQKLAALFLRILAMVNNFSIQSDIENQAKLVAKRPQVIPTIAASDSLLQNNAIPFYFNVIKNGNNNDVLKFWNTQGGNLKNIYCYYDSVLPGRDVDMAPKLADTDWYNYNFFRIEGHVGMSKIAAISEITKLINNLGLPVQLLDCDVTYKGPQKWIDFYDEYVGKMGVWVKALRQNYLEYSFGPFKNIQENVNQTSYRLVDEVTKTMNNLNAFSGIMYSGPVKTKAFGKTKAIGDKAKGIPESAYGRYAEKVSKEDLKSLNKKYQDAMAELTDAKASKLIMLSELADLEFMGGAIRGGTFVLLHNGQTVVGDGCLPYYYRVNQIRVFNPVT